MSRCLVMLMVIALSVHVWMPPCRAEPAGEPGADPSCSALATQGAEVETIRRLELRGGRVNVEGWGIGEARLFFAPDFVSVQPDGSTVGLDTLLSRFVDGRSPGWARSFEVTELDIRVFDCRTAVVVGTAEWRALAAPEGAPATRVRFLNVWRKADRRWQYWANQYTRLTAGAGER